MTSTLCVAYTSDDNYAKYLSISMLSLFRANAAFSRIRVFVLDCGIGDENRTRLYAIAEAEGREITFLPVKDIKERLPLRSDGLGIAVAAYGRLFLQEILPKDVERALYLDCDTIVLSSLQKLWETNLGCALVAGVQDTVDRFFQKVISLPLTEKYLNSGVLLINIKAWRDENIGSRFSAFIAQFGGKVPHHDQGTINGVCGSRRVILPIRYNVMTNVYSFSARTIRRMYFLDSYYEQPEVDAALRDPAIIHFTSGLVGRPWEEGCTHPARERYRALMRDTPWGDGALLPRTLKRSTRAFGWTYRHMPRPMFEAMYRALCWALHLRSFD